MVAYPSEHPYWKKQMVSWRCNNNLSYLQPCPKPPETITSFLYTGFPPFSTLNFTWFKNSHIPQKSQKPGNTSTNCSQPTRCVEHCSRTHKCSTKRKAQGISAPNSQCSSFAFFEDNDASLWPQQIRNITPCWKQISLGTALGLLWSSLISFLSFGVWFLNHKRGVKLTQDENQTAFQQLFDMFSLGAHWLQETGYGFDWPRLEGIRFALPPASQWRGGTAQFQYPVLNRSIKCSTAVPVYNTQPTIPTHDIDRNCLANHGPFPHVKIPPQDAATSATEKENGQ